jgi:hypothetical protein
MKWHSGSWFLAMVAPMLSGSTPENSAPHSNSTNTACNSNPECFHDDGTLCWRNKLPARVRMCIVSMRTRAGTSNACLPRQASRRESCT